MMNGERKEGICRLNVDGNGCGYLRILSDLETKLRNNTNPKEKIELALQGALMFYGADRAYVIEVDDELGIGVNTYECCAPGIAPEIDNLQFMPFEMFPRWLCSLKSDTPIIITDLERIKTEFLEEYSYLGKRSVNSLLAVPFQKRLNAGFLGVDNPKRNVEDPGFLRLVILCVVVELNEILLQEWRERRYASIKQPTIIQANLFGKLEIISATDVLKDDSFTNESGYVLLTFLLLNRTENTAREELRLLSAVTPKGEVFYQHTAQALADRFIVFRDEYGAVSRLLLELIRAEALARGYHIITCPCAMHPEDKIDHILIPELRLAFLTDNRWHRVQLPGMQAVRCTRFLDRENLAGYRARLRFNERAAAELLEQATALMAQAKSCHDELETYYRTTVDFAQVDEAAARCAKLFGLEAPSPDC